MQDQKINKEVGSDNKTVNDQPKEVNIMHGFKKFHSKTGYATAMKNNALEVS